MSGVLLAAVDLAVGRGLPLLRGVEFAIRTGECWFAIGPNGAGKSTLVATLLGLLPPLAGRVERAPAIADRSGLGFVPQEPRFGRTLPMTPTEFVSLGIQPGVASRVRAARAAAALRVMGLDAGRGRVLAELSLGQRRRVLVARALAREPQLLVLDEPTANLDEEAAHGLAAALERLRCEAGLGVLHVAHDRALVRTFATHVVAVDGGVCRCGRAGEVLAATGAGVGT